MKEEIGCGKCKPKDITISQIELYTKEEFDEIMPMLDRYSMTPQEIQYIYDFYNRVFGTSKRPGCGKCFINIAKHLKARYREKYNN